MSARLPVAEVGELTYERFQSRKRKPGPTAKARAKRRRSHAPIVKDVRAKVVDRANGSCERCGQYCGDCGHAHHRIPRSRGGKWTVENIEYLCPGCHLEAHLTGAL